MTAARSKKASESSPDLPFAAADVAGRLLDWYGHSGRQLPWRGTRDPYRIWLSEIMLQQTTVAAVIPYYQRFLERFPDVISLAAAPVDEVISLWAGLGYYSRARNLHAAAQQVAERWEGQFPTSVEELCSLPGIGRSTAGAILSIAFDCPAPILDGNVRRVLCRLLAIDADPRSTPVERRLWQAAETLTPADRPHDYAQAIMDLGATICAPRSPDCPACPLNALCQARMLGMEKELPRRRSKAPVPTRHQVGLLLERNGRFLLRRRPYQGLLGGMWEFPCGEIRGEGDSASAEGLLAELGLSGDLQPLGSISHTYSHFHLDLQLFYARVSPPQRIMESDDSCWVAPMELIELPLHGAHKKAWRLFDQAMFKKGL